MRIKKALASLAMACMVLTGIGLTAVATAAPAQAHTTSVQHWGNCYVALNGDTWCQRHCSYIELTYYGCTNSWWYWKSVWWA